MRIISYNVNGIRAAITKGFADWLKDHPADVICLQEIKAQLENIPVERIEELGYKTFWCPAEKKGYSGVAILTKQIPDNVVMGCSMEQSNVEGRIIRADFNDLTLINAYFPSGTMGEIRQAFKYEWLNDFLNYLNELKKERPKLIVCGDYNIAHKEIDIHDPKKNQNTTGFLPEERQWMDKFFANGFVDSFRVFNQDPHHYSWWSQRFPSVRLNNKGWRLDYISVTENLVPHLKGAAILPHVKHSDHCPVMLELSL